MWHVSSRSGVATSRTAIHTCYLPDGHESEQRPAGLDQLRSLGGDILAQFTRLEVLAPATITQPVIDQPLTATLHHVAERRLPSADNQLLRLRLLICFHCPVWARGCCRISPPRFLAECCKRQLNQGSLSHSERPSCRAKLITRSAIDIPKQSFLSSEFGKKQHIAV